MSFQIGNTKLGQWILNWSLAAILTCPGRSKACQKECYADKFRYRSKVIQDAYAANKELADSAEFVEHSVAEIRRKGIRVCRWHASGDFYEAEDGPVDRYVNTVIEICERLPMVYFYAYTRSWDVPSLRPALIRLSRLPNFRLWLSTDKTMTKPPKWKHTKIAYMSVEDTDAPRYPVDLVFRAGSKANPMKRDKRGNLVCPYEQNIPRKIPLTCSTCGICFDQMPVVPLSAIGSARRSVVGAR